MKKLALILLPLLLASCNGNSNQIEYKNFEILTFQPYYTAMSGIKENVEAGWLLPEGFTDFSQLLFGAGTLLSKRTSKITYKDENFSKDEILNGHLFQKLGPNQIILFEGHGSLGYLPGGDTEQRSVMWTGQLYDEKKETTDEDYIEGRLVDSEGNEAITMFFIEHYVSDLSGSIIYLGNCYSGRDCTFAQSFLKKGAAAVIANSHPIQSIYNSLMEYTTMDYLTQINPMTNKTYTIYEALSKAKSIYGKDDGEKKPLPNRYPSEPIIYGNPYFSLSLN